MRRPAACDVVFTENFSQLKDKKAFAEILKEELHLKKDFNFTARRLPFSEGARTLEVKYILPAGHIVKEGLEVTLVEVPNGKFPTEVMHKYYPLSAPFNGNNSEIAAIIEQMPSCKD
jgi:hypothetical protein